MNHFHTTQALRLKSKSLSGFTLIELLVVIAIISLLSSMIMAAVQDAREQAQEAVAKQEMQNMKEIMILAQGNYGRSLQEITGDSCTDCPCRFDNFEDSQCINDTRDSFQKILNAAGAEVNDIDEFIRDPWGTVYLLDENEGETGHPGHPDDCRLDRLFSVGADKTWGTDEDIVLLIPVGGECL